MKTRTQLVNLFGSLSQNTSATNLTLGGQLIDDQHRYLLQKYFDNEKTVTLTTIGGQSLTLTGSLIAGATTATLTAVWSYPTYRQYVTFDDGEQRYALFTYNSAAISWADGLTGAVGTSVTTLGVQDYNIPANVSKIKNDTINVGQLKYQPTFVHTRQEWDEINFLPYTSDIPQYCFIYNGKMSIFPIPSTTGNIITFNYKTRVASLTFSDYSTGAIATGGATPGSAAVSGASTSWATTAGYPTGSDISYFNLNLKIDPPYGDGIWYPINSVTSDTALTLSLPVINAPKIITGSTYTIGQLPLLQEDFHDMLVYGALKIYFSSIVPDSDKFMEYDALYQERLQLLEAYAGTKNTNVDLGVAPQAANPNLFIYAQD